MHELAPQWLRGCRLRTCWFEPTFQKHVGKLCAGLQIHVEEGSYAHTAFRPWRLHALAFKALRTLEPKYPLWRDFVYEYERGRLAIDVLNGSDLLRRWVDDRRSTAKDLDDIDARRRALVAPRARARSCSIETARVPLVSICREWPTRDQRDQCAHGSIAPQAPSRIPKATKIESAAV